MDLYRKLALVLFFVPFYALAYDAVCQIDVCATRSIPGRTNGMTKSVSNRPALVVRCIVRPNIFLVYAFLCYVTWQVNKLKLKHAPRKRMDTTKTRSRV